MIALPDPATFAVLPWRPEEQGVGRMFCDIVTPERTPYEGDPRHVLRRAVERAQGDGLRHVQRGAGARVLPVPRLAHHRAARPRRVLRPDDARRRLDVRRETVLALEQLGIHVEYTHHEVGPSQHEIDMRYADALKMADDCMTYRITVKEYAMKYGWHATFMPKPLFGENGSGMHTHQSLFSEGRNAFFDPDDAVLPLGRRQGVHRRPAAPRARDLLGLRAVGQLLQAPRPGLRGAHVRRVVAAQPLGARARAAVPPRPRARDAHGAALPRPRVQPLPDVRGAAAGGPGGDREGVRAARADGAEPLPPLRRGAPAPRRRAAAGDARGRDRADRAVGARAAHAGRAHVQPLRGDQAPGVGGLPRAGVPVGARPVPLDSFD